MSARDRSTFGGTHRPIPRDNRAHNQREAQDRASFDNAPVTGGCAALMLTFLAMVLAVLTGVALG